MENDMGGIFLRSIVVTRQACDWLENSTYNLKRIETLIRLKVFDFDRVGAPGAKGTQLKPGEISSTNGAFGQKQTENPTPTRKFQKLNPFRMHRRLNAIIEVPFTIFSVQKCCLLRGDPTGVPKELFP
ncbi:MAG: hypothetical protein IPP59_11405 [Betaproteobacteria bacterium]|nr:hypothetical protein [Candidatus Dechloromonas phosphorivorans]